MVSKSAVSTLTKRIVASALGAWLAVMSMGIPAPAQEPSVQRGGAGAAARGAPLRQAVTSGPVTCDYGVTCMIDEGQSAQWSLEAFCFSNGEPVNATVDATGTVTPRSFTVSFSPKTVVITPAQDPSPFTMTTSDKIPAGTYTIAPILTAKAGPCTSYPFSPPTTTLQVAPAKPANFRQVGAGVAKSGGVLHFSYAWDSSSGDLADLKNCQVGEDVTYPGGNPFIWPKPPYNGQTPNPTILWVAAKGGKAQDNHSAKPFVKPYTADAFIANQDYRYQCTSPSSGIVNFPGETGITITRTVSDSTGRGCWGYTVFKSGANASDSPLPGVPKADCGPGPALVADNPGSKVGSNEIGMSISPPTVSAGLNEPIFVDLTVSNKTAQTVGVDLGLDVKSNLELTISDPSGAVMTQTLSSAGFGLSGEVSLAPHGTFMEKLLLNEWYAFPLIGTYRVKMTLLNADGTAGADSPSTDFSVHIGPRDPAKLATISRELADKAITGATLDEKADAAITLSYMVDPMAVDSLIRVLQQGSLVAHYAVGGLGRIGNPEAMAALTAARDYLDEEVRTAVRHALGVIQGQAPGPSGPVE